jgi:polyhydroxyalkanoate synthesis regulator phasin
MLEDLKNAFSKGLSTLDATAELAENRLMSLVSQGKATREEIKTLARQIAEDAQKDVDTAKTELKGFIDRTIDSAGLVKKAELEALQLRVAQLEKELKALSK